MSPWLCPRLLQVHAYGQIVANSPYGVAGKLRFRKMRVLNSHAPQGTLPMPERQPLNKVLSSILTTCLREALQPIIRPSQSRQVKRGTRYSQYLMIMDWQRWAEGWAELELGD